MLKPKNIIIKCSPDFFGFPQDEVHVVVESGEDSVEVGSPDDSDVHLLPDEHQHSPELCVGLQLGFRGISRTSLTRSRGRIHFLGFPGFEEQKLIRSRCDFSPPKDAIDCWLFINLSKKD